MFIPLFTLLLPSPPTVAAGIITHLARTAYNTAVLAGQPSDLSPSQQDELLHHFARAHFGDFGGEGAMGEGGRLSKRKQKAW